MEQEKGMKKIIATILLFIFAFGVFGCSIPQQLTLDKVVELSDKGYELTWSDFEQYYGYECGSGLYILCYRIDDEYEVRIGSFSPDDKYPMYIYLRRNNDTGDPEFIDIRTEDVQAFIDEWKGE